MKNNKQGFQKSYILGESKHFYLLVSSTFLEISMLVLEILSSYLISGSYVKENPVIE